MFTILVSILCSTLVFAGPVTQLNTSISWSTLRNDSSLARFQSTLLDPTLVTFLNDCYSAEQSNNNVRIPCARYFDAILQLNSTDFVVPQPTVIKMLNKTNRDFDFCKQNHTFPAMKNFPTKVHDFTNPAICGYLCINEDGDSFAPKPICVFLAWLGEEIMKHTAVVAAEVPLVPADNTKTNSLFQPMLTNAGSSQDKVMPATSVNDTAKPRPLHTDDTKDAPKIKPIPAADKPSEVTEKKPAPEPDQKQEQPNKQEVNKPQPIETVAAGVATSTKDVKKEQSSSSNAPAVTETTDEDALPKYPANAENQDSFGVDQMNEDQQNDNDSDLETNEDGIPDNGDDDDDHDALLQSKASKATQKFATGEPKNSIETVDDNYLSKVNPVIDPFQEESGSNFFTYFLLGMFLCIVMYVVYHNKSKILALLLEGRRSDKGRGGRRKHTAAYRKLDSNLEEAITSSASGRITQIIY